MPCLLPDGVVVDVEDAQAWIQNSVYEDYLVTVENGFVVGRPGIILSRTSATKP